MKVKGLISPFWVPLFANDNDPFIPEVWAMESLMILHENTVAAQLVHKDFSNEVARRGDIVNTRRPAKFTGERKVDGDTVTTQDATAENVAVPLDQHVHVSFVIYDGEESKGMVSLRDTYLVPAVQAIAQMVDEIVLGQKYEFVENVAGNLGTAIDRAGVIEVGTKLDELLCPPDGRNFLVSPATKGDLLNIADYTTADKIGDNGTRMREGSLGRVMGLNTVMSQNLRAIAASDTQTGALINNAAGYPAGTTVLTVDGTLGAAAVAGEWITIAGDDAPQMLTSVTGTTSPTSFTIWPGLHRAVVNNAVITNYSAGAYDGALAIGWNKDIEYDGVTLAPRLGQLVSAGVAADPAMYSTIGTAPTTTTAVFNRSLDAAIADDAILGLGPAGDYNFAFHRNAIALVSRPLAMPAPNAGALSSVQSMDGLGIRVTITYDGAVQGHRVTVDLLCGTKTLDSSLGCLVLA